MPRSRLILLLLVLLYLAGCGPAAVIGSIGNVFNRAVQRAEDNAALENGGQPAPSPSQYNNPQSYDRLAIARANLDLGVAYMQQGDNRAALDKLTRATIARPDYAPTYNVLGVFYQRIGNNEKAEANFKKSLDLDGGNFDTLNNYASFLCQTDRYDEAHAVYLETAGNRLNPNPEIALANAGQCAINHGKPAVGEDYLRQALGKNPRLAPALVQMADISCDRGDYLAARDYLQRYLEISKHTPRSLWLGIRIEQQLGDKDTVSSYALLLRNKYADSREAQLLEESGIY